MAIASIFDQIRDPQKIYNWEVEFVSPQPNATDTLLKYYAKNVSLPLHSIETTKRYFSGSKYHIPMKDNSPSILNTTMWDNSDGEVYEFFLGWFYMINKTDKEFSLLNAFSGFVKETGATPKDFLMTCRIKLLNNDGSIRVIHTFKNCFVSEVGEMNLNYNESADATFDVRFIYDSYTMERV